MGWSQDEDREAAANLPPLPEFPLGLSARKVRANMTSVELDAMMYHNRVIGAFVSEHNCVTGELRPNERAILRLAAGLDAWCRYMREEASSPFGAQEVTRPLFNALNDALNHGTGRLDARTLHEWSRDLLIACGVDTD